MGVEGVGNGLSNQNSYDEGDVERMKGLEALSTQAAINQIGGFDTTHTIHGSDRTEAEVVAEHQDRVQERWTKELIGLIPGIGESVETGMEIRESLEHGDLRKAIESGSKRAVFEVADRLAEHAIEHAGRFGFRALGAAVPLLKLYKLAKAMVESVAEDADTGHARAEARIKSAMHTTIIGSLNGLPQDFVNQERTRYAADAPSSLVQRMNAALAKKNALMGVIQLHCDQGISSARAMYAAGQSSTDYLRAHTDVAKRVAEDPAFKAGFEGAIYAHEHGQYDELLKGLEARDARYALHNVSFQG